jgi:drug/metabolite transporter (DMT)-like permease
MTRRPVVALVLAALCWGLGTVISRRAVEEIQPLTLLAIQLTSSLVFLGLVLAWQGRLRVEAGTPAILGRLGLLNPGLGYGLGLLGLANITASLAVLLWAVEPLLILALAAVFFREPVGRSFVGLSLVAVAGMAMVVYEPGATGGLIGIALTLAGVACCAAYTIIARRWLGDGQAAAPVVLVQQIYALGLAIASLAVIAVAGGSVVGSETSTVAWASAILSGLLYYGTAYVLYLSALRTMPAAIAAASFYLIPVFGIAGSIALLGERLTTIQWVGAGIALGAVYLLLRRQPSRASASAQIATTPIASSPR